MGLLNPRKRPADKVEADRQKAILYKRLFGSPEGKEVLIDLMNRFYVLNPLPFTDALLLARAEGHRVVILDLLSRAHVNIEELDKLLRGEI